MIITVTAPVNSPPSVKAGPTQIVKGGSEVSLNGTATDHDKDVMTYLWTHNSTLSDITLANATSASTTFTAPRVDSDTAIAFTLTANDDTATSSDSVIITVTAHVNSPPSVKAGPTQIVKGGSKVSLNGTATDHDEDVMTYLWTHNYTSSDIALANDTSASTTFTAPRVDSDTAIAFTLTANDDTATSSDSVIITVTAPVNSPPSVKAGPTQTVQGGSEVSLNGTATDHDEDVMTYLWTHNYTSSDITLANATSASTTFTAPRVDSNTDIAFTLTADDGTATSSDSVIITVTAPVNSPPSVKAGPTQTVQGGSEVSLNGTATDHDEDVMTYLWTHNYTSSDITLANATSASTTFTAPRVDSNTDIAFTLTADDGTATSSDSVIITVTAHVNSPPSVKAGPTQTVQGGSEVSLNGTATDHDKDVMTYLWTHNSTLSDITLANATSASTTFTAPRVDSDTAIAFTLTANDDTATSSDSVIITVTAHVNSPPSVKAGPTQIVKGGSEVSLNGTATDHDKDVMTYLWTHNSTLSDITLANATSASTTFTAPRVDSDTAIAFTLTANDDTATSSDSVIITVTAPVNSPPSVKAGPTQIVKGGSEVSLNGTATDHDKDVMTYLWTHNSTLSDITLANATSASTTFTAPRVDSDTAIAFTLTANDDTATSSDSVIITVTAPVNSPPSVKAGPTQIVKGGSEVSLNGTATDHDEDVMTYLWTHNYTSSDITLANATSASTTFTAPYVSSNTTLTLTLTADDGTAEVSDSVDILIMSTQNVHPVLDVILEQAVDEMSTLIFVARATDEDLPSDTLTYGLEDPPAGASMNSATGAFTWTPTEYQNGIHTVTVTVSDDRGGTDSQDVKVTVNEVNMPPTLDVIPAQTIDEPPMLTFTVNASDDDLHPGVGIEVVAGKLKIPWSIDWTPDRTALFTERGGDLRIIRDGILLPDPIFSVDVNDDAEGGLLGIAVDPEFEENQYIYMYQTYKTDGTTLNKVVRYTLANATVSEDLVLVDGIPGASYHDGGRIQFGPDGNLYITTGDAGNPSLAQDLDSLAGKILRITREGAIPQDNPFSNSAVWSWGHRNPQGMDWDGSGNLIATEHGPSGERGVAHDEINLILPGANYGWPETVGDESMAGMQDPLLHTGSETWAPSGSEFYDGDMIPGWTGKYFVANLRGEHLRMIDLDLSNNGTHSHEGLFEGQFGRLRDVQTGPDGFLYLLTSNRDGRGSPVSNDDRILKIVPVFDSALSRPANVLTYGLEASPAGASMDPATGTFTWRPTEDQNGIHTITVTVSDGNGGTNSQEVQVTVNVVNVAPIVDAGSDQTALEGQTVMLNGTATDHDEDVMTYLWTHNSTSSDITLANATSASTTFTAPRVDSDTAIAFTLTADDGTATSSDSVIITVTAHVNSPPVADAGSDQTALEGQTVMLNGTATDADGDSLTYLWSHNSSLAIQLANSTSPSTTFAAPAVDADTAVTFTLTVDDGIGISSDQVTITITAHVNLTLAVTSIPAGTTPEAAFVTTWQTTSANEFILIPVGESTGTYTVNWGDASIDTDVSGHQMHTYKNAGTYTVSIYGDFSQIYLPYYFENALKLQSIEQWGDIRWESMRSAFSGATNMVYRATDAPDLSDVTDTSEMFMFATSFNGNLSTWDVSHVTDMRGMFDIATAFNGDISSWNVSGVTDMSNMFLAAWAFTQNLGDWYIVLDETTISDANTMLAISAQNAYLDGQNPVYTIDLIAPGGDKFRIVNGSHLATRTDQTVAPGQYNVTIKSTGSFGTDNSKIVGITMSEDVILQTNNPPSVKAGPTQIVKGGSEVSLNGTATDHDKDVMTYLWTHNSTLSDITLANATSASTTFTAPRVDSDTAIAFTLTANDDTATSSDSVIITVTAHVNSPPSVKAGPTQIVKGGSEVSLNGTATDHDKDVMTYLWTHNSTSSDIALANATSASTTFTAPRVDSDTAIAFTLTANDDTATSSDSVIITVTAHVNSPPSVKAGPTQIVKGGSEVSLNGTATDHDKDVMTYLWTHNYTSSDITLANATSASTTFTAPRVDSDTAIAFTLTADDGTATSSDSVIITVTAPVNSPPSVKAGPTQIVKGGSEVSLNGTATDHDKDVMTYLWTHNSTSSDIALANDTSASTTFTAPRVDSDTAIAFTLTADDGTATSSDSVIITVTAPVNSPPSVKAGPTQIVKGGSEVSLNGTATDHDKDVMTYLWTHNSTLSDITLANATSASTTFTAPRVDSDTAIAFTLTANDDTATSSDSVIITVTAHVNSPPSVKAGPTQIVQGGSEVSLNGTATDHDKDVMTYLWTHNYTSSDIALANATSASTTFTAPRVDSDTAIAFTLTANDDTATSSDSVIITVTAPVNSPPSVKAGPTQIVKGGSEVSLNGTATDHDKDVMTYLWTHNSTLSDITLANATSASTTFTAPRVDSDTAIAFTLTADDGTEARSDTVTVTITDVQANDTQTSSVVLEPQEPRGTRDIGLIILNSTLPGVIDVAWGAPSEAPVDYRLSWTKASTQFPTWTDLSGNAFPTDTSYTITGLEEDEAYKVVVRARYDGTSGDWSGKVTITVAETATTAVTFDNSTVPGAPRDLAVSRGGSGALTVSWQAPSSDGGLALSGYMVQWKEAGGSWDVQADVSEETTTATTHTVTGLTNGVSYTVRVLATNQAGSGSHSAEEAGTPLALREIAGLTLSSTTAGTVRVAWDAPSEAPVDYRLSWAKAGTQFLTWTDLSGNAFPTDTSYTITDLEEGEDYKVVVRARYDGASGDWSDKVIITVAGTG